MSWSPLTELNQFAPSANPTTQSILTDCLDLIPSEKGWRSAYGLATTGMDTMTATCVGSAMVRLTSNSLVILAGTATGLFVRSSNAWNNVSGSETYAASSEQRWRFATMGDNILAATKDNVIQVSASGATFTAISGAPKAALIESVYGFIMAAGTNEANYGSQPDRWWCSAIFDHTAWTPDVTVQCVTGRLVDTPGPITALRRLGSNIVAYKQDSMYLAEFVEAPTVWDWRLVSSNVGCISHDAVVNIGKAHLFPGPDNFYIFDGASVVAIGEPLREWFFDQVLAPGSAELIQASHDAAKALVYWYFPATGVGETACNRAVVYNYKVGRWGYCSYAIQSAVDYVAAGITYDGLGGYFTTWDAGIDRTYDSPNWTVEKVTPAVIDSAGLLKTIDGASTTSQFTTWHMGDDQRYSLFRGARIRWLTAPTAATMRLSALQEHGGVFCTCGQPVAQSANKFDKMMSSRWHRLKFEMTGTHEFSGLQIDIVPQGDW